MIDALIFDKDGTLFDFRQSWGNWVAQVARDLAAGQADPAAGAAALALRIGYDLHTGRFAPDSPVIAGTPDDIADALMAELPLMSRPALVGRLNALAEATPMAEAVPLGAVLSGLRGRGLRLGLATNDAEAPARAHLQSHGLTDLFDFVAGYDSGWGAKPGPGMLTAFVARFALEPARVAMVGDSLHDLVAGRAAGMRTVAVLTGIAGAAELAPMADVVLDDIGGLESWIAGLASDGPG